MNMNPLPTTYHSRSRRAFTLVELLVVITIIGILIALLLPAVQAAREAARRLKCCNHLKQVGVAANLSLELLGHYPTGGNLWYVVGDADLGSGSEQMGGWIFNILPYMEQESLYMLGAGEDNAGKKVAAMHRLQTPLSWSMCPSRRELILYPNALNRPYRLNGHPATAATSPTLARTDYAACVGDTLIVQRCDYPDNLFTGVCYSESKISSGDISDGTSNTYFAGERFINTDHYLTGRDPGDDDSMYCGDNYDSLRSAYPGTRANHSDRWPLLQDMQGYMGCRSFGSAHANGLHMLLCDGSVHSASYSINPLVYANLANRHDGNVIDSKSKGF